MYDTSPPPRRGFLGLLGRLYGALDSSRRFAMNLIFLLLVVLLLSLAFAPSAPPLQEKTALVLNLSGRIVEQYTGRSRLMALTRSFEDDEDLEVQLRDVLAVLDAAQKDAKIERILLMTDDLSGGGLSSLREIAAAMERFKAAGKQIVAYGGNFDQRRYYLASHANEVYLHPMGMVALEGYGGYRNYYKNALDKLGISANVVRAGKYKNFGEPFFAAQPSKETLESDKALYDDLWATYTSGVEKARKLEAGSIGKGIDRIDVLMAEQGGDLAKVALKGGLVNALKTRDEVRQLMIERGAKDEANKTFRQVSFHNYHATIRPKTGGDAVAVVVAEGEISEGNAPAGQVGGRSTAELIRKARNDDSIKAIVLRVNSPGGSAVGSEFVRRELELAKAGGKPVVVSMGDVAASGGYWVSMGADEVIADVATITGSIGVFGMLPTGEKAMEKLSINTGGYATTWLRESGYDPRRPLDPRFAKMVQSAIDHIYTDFTTRAAAVRKTSVEKIDEVGQGRVWTGAQAKARGLIDRNGSYTDALKAALSRAKLPEDAPIVYVEPERTKLERFLEHFGSGAARIVARQIDAALLPVTLGKPAAEVRRELGWLAEVSERAKAGMPFAAITHCLCAQP